MAAQRKHWERRIHHRDELAAALNGVTKLRGLFEYAAIQRAMSILEELHEEWPALLEMERHASALAKENDRLRQLVRELLDAHEPLLRHAPDPQGLYALRRRAERDAPGIPTSDLDRIEPAGLT